MGSICQNCIKVRKKKITNTDSESNNLIFIDSKKKYSSEEYDTILKDFINKTIEKDEFYDYKDGDEVFNLQKKYEKNELNKFFQLNKNKINEQIETSLNTTNKILINFDMNKLVSDVINLENGKNTYSEKIGNIIKEVQSNNSKYINIIVIGKHGIGKKTLINKIFKLKNIKLNIMPNQEKEIEELNREVELMRNNIVKDTTGDFVPRVEEVPEERKTEAPKAKKPATKKVVEKKAPAKKVTDKKSETKKVPAKKTADKKPSTKKVAEKKAPAKKAKK